MKYNKTDKTILGCCILEKDIAKQIIENYNESYFHSNLSKRLFNKINFLYQSGKVINEALLTLDVIQDKELTEYAFECVNSVVTVKYFQTYLRQMIENKIEKELKILSEQMSETIPADVNIHNILNYFAEKIHSLKPAEQKSKADMLYDITNEYENLMRIGNEMDSGIPTLDLHTNGFRRKRLYVLGGRPGSGKTGLGLYIAHRIAFLKGMKVLFFSLEMSDFEIVGRLVSIIENVPAWKIQKPWLMKKDDLFKFARACGLIYNSHFEIVEGNLKIGQIINKIEQFKPDFVVIDHLQCIALPGDKYQRLHEVLGDFTTQLHNVTKKENFCLLLLSQKTKILGNHNQDDEEFKGSSTIKEKTDIGMILSRPEPTKEKPLPDGFLNLSVIKNRYGNIKYNIPLILNLDNLTFKEYNEDE